MSGRLSILVLGYGDYPALLERCLGSIRNALQYAPLERVADVRLALNAPSDVMLSRGRALLQELPVPALLYLPVPATRNALKYPMMRKMLYDPRHPIPELVMWFDDDSYLDAAVDAGWWKRIFELADGHDIIGQRWYAPVRGDMLRWVKDQPWYNPEVPPTVRYRDYDCFPFFQGAWWVVRRELVLRLDWPFPELRHNGGDVMFGEACRHIGARMCHFDEGVHINSGEDGGRSTSRRRGVSEVALGVIYAGKPDVSAYHDFEIAVEEWPCAKMEVR